MKRFKTKARMLAAGAIVALTVPALQAETPNLGAENYSMFGISRVTGNFWRYDFADGTNIYTGKVRDQDGNALVGIDASVYFEYFQSIHAFWNDPSDGQTKMLRVDALTGVAALDVINLGTGAITGAVSHTVDNPAPDVEGKAETKTFHIYALQTATGSGDGVSGGININPNNGNNSEFTCTVAGGVTYTRDDLHSNSNVDADGVFYEGGATYVMVKPKGNGNQNSLVVNGEVFNVANANTYEIASTGNMQVRIQNDKLKNGKAMGHWWIDITADTATITVNGGPPISAAPAPVSEVIRIDTQTRDVTKITTLTRVYDALASKDMTTFWATSGNNLYKINASTGVETLIKTMSSNQMHGLEFAGDNLMCFELVDDRLLPVDALTGEVLGFSINVGMHNLGTLTFINSDLLPDAEYSRYD